jgi:hypothetical protein
MQQGQPGRAASVVGVVLIFLGIISLAYFASPVRLLLRETIGLGRINFVPPILGGLRVISGIALLFPYARGRKRRLSDEWNAVDSFISADIRESHGSIADLIHAHPDGRIRLFNGCVKDDNRRWFSIRVLNCSEPKLQRWDTYLERSIRFHCGFHAFRAELILAWRQSSSANGNA